MSVTRISISSSSGVPACAWNTSSSLLNAARKSSSFLMGLIFIDSLHIDLVISGMRSNELHPGYPRSVLHLHDQTVLVASDVKNHPVVATNTCVAVFSRLAWWLSRLAPTFYARIM